MRITLELDAEQTEALYAFADAQNLRVDQAAADIIRKGIKPVPFRRNVKQAAHEEDVAFYYAKKYSDGLIGEKTGLSTAGVQRIRARLGLPALYGRGGKLLTTEDTNTTGADDER